MLIIENFNTFVKGIRSDGVIRMSGIKSSWSISLSIYENSIGTKSSIAAELEGGYTGYMVLCSSMPLKDKSILGGSIFFDNKPLHMSLIKSALITPIFKSFSLKVEGFPTTTA